MSNATRMVCAWIVLAALILLCVSAPVAADEPLAAPGEALRFAPGEQGAFTFDTGVIQGQLRGAGRAFGLSRATHVPSGQTLCGMFDLLAVYRVFSDGVRYGAAGWEWPSEAGVNDDGSVTVRCAAEPQRPFALSGVYRWVTPRAVDLEITVTPQQELHGFEVFLASYFDAAFTNAAAYVAENPQQDGQPGFMSAREESGFWQMFPRDEQALALIQDGRWELPPHPVQWVILPRLERPLALRRVPSSGLTVVLMTRPEDGLAIAMPYETEVHFSVYLSLFGRDLPPGDTAQARVRLQVFDAPQEHELVDAYRDFLQSAGARR